MSRSSNHKYRSYREKKSQSKRFRIYFVRVFFLLLFYSIFTSFVAISLSITGNSMSPNLNRGNSLILLPSKNLNSLLQREPSGNYRRGEVVLTGTNYVVDASLWEKVLDPVVRVFTLQKKSLLYSNSEYKGRGEILRVVGLPGDTVKIKDNTVYIKPKGEEFFLSEFEINQIDYDIDKMLLKKEWKDEYPFSSEQSEEYINEGFYFLMSDNRSVFNDSRVFGQVKKNEIKGRVLLKYWPVNEFDLY